MTPHLIKYRAFDVRILERGGAFEVSWSCGESSGVGAVPLATMGLAMGTAKCCIDAGYEIAADRLWRELVEDGTVGTGKLG